MSFSSTSGYVRPEKGLSLTAPVALSPNEDMQFI